MKKRKTKQIILVSIFLMVLSNALFGNETLDLNVSKLIDIAGKQRMLSQRIAKDYLYVGKKIATGKANKQLKATFSEFLKIHNKLKSLVSDAEIKNMLDFVALSSDDLKSTSSQEFTLDNAQLVLDLSESMLEGNQYIVDALKRVYDLKESNSLEKLGKQRMLSQRIAKYYMAYQSGIKDENTVKSMKDTVKEFSENLDLLLQNKNNTERINKKLQEINKLWKIVRKFYNNIEQGGLPLIVFNTTDNITKKMDEITKLYMVVDK